MFPYSIYLNIMDGKSNKKFKFKKKDYDNDSKKN